MNKASKDNKIKKVLITLILCINHVIPAYGMYNYFSSWLTNSAPELSNNNNNNNNRNYLTASGKTTHESDMFLIAGTATRSKDSSAKYVRFKTPQREESINDLSCWFFGLFDGINGDIISEYLETNILPTIRSYAQQNVPFKEALQNAIHAIHEHSLKASQSSGSSVLLATIDQYKNLIIAHAGNSLAVLKTADQHKLLTQPHTLGNKEEYKRIPGPFFNEKTIIPKPCLSSYNVHAKAIIYGSSGCIQPSIMQPAPNDYYLNACECDVIANVIGPNTSYTSRTTRGVGQAHFIPLFISTLDIQEIKLGQRHRFLILGTSGFWDVISPQAAVNIVEDCIEQEMSNGKDTYEKNLNPHSIAQTLVDRAWGMIDYKACQNFDRNKDHELNLTHDNDITVTVILFSANIYRYLIFR